ncbi:MAG: hypothetical protein IPM18_14080 [Phycisphaerales bacterium]|nr:hypothetical protein [Phycisphaerales bacterium]
MARKTMLEPVTLDPLAGLLEHRRAEQAELSADAAREAARRAECWKTLVSVLAKPGASKSELVAANEAAAELGIDDGGIRGVHEALKERMRLQSLASELEARELARVAAVRAVLSFAESAEQRLRELKLTSSRASAAKREAMAARDLLASWPERHPELAAAVNELPT